MDTKLLLKEGNSLCRLNSQASIADCTYENILNVQNGWTFI